MTDSSTILANGIRRARPWLGTLVEIRASGLPDVELIEAVEAAYNDIGQIHSLMSFHEVDSELSRLNRAAGRSPQAVHPHTAAVLTLALRIATDSDGCFDPCIGASMVQSGALPRSCAALEPDRYANWQDVHIHADGKVSFKRPLWLDLGGIAKGYAVDCAIERLRAAGVQQACVNAGGDLRVFGPESQRVELRLPGLTSRLQPVLDLLDGAVAGSASGPSTGIAEPVHFHGATRLPPPPGVAVVVAASCCAVADALTKCVLLDPGNADRILRRHGAQARLHDGKDWRSPEELSTDSRWVLPDLRVQHPAVTPTAMPV